MNNIAIGSRIRQLRKSANLSQEEFASILGISQNVVSRYERGELTPKVDTLNQMIEQIGGKAGYDIQWLVTGRGVVLNSVPESSISAARPNNTQQENDEYVYLPLCDAIASSGAGSYVDDDAVIGSRAFSKQWIREEGLNSSYLTLIKCKGDSMDPTLKSGDTLLVDRSVTEVTDDAIYVLRLDDVLVVKRLQKIYDGSIYIKSDNTAYAPHQVPRSAIGASVHIIGRVV